MTEEQQSPRLQQVKTCTKATVSGTQGSPVSYPHLHCQPLNEIWEGVDLGSIPSRHSRTLHAHELPWIGPAFPPGAQSLVQAVT